MRLRHFLRSSRGAAAAEFALILPVLLIFLLGIIDVGMWMWTVNRAEKATQVGVRHAAVTNYVAGGLDELNYTDAGYVGGQTVPVCDIPRFSCTSSGCSLRPNECGSTPPIPGGISLNAAALQSILSVMRTHFPELTLANLRVSYRHVGLGYAGDPNGSAFNPEVTVEIVDPDKQLFNPIFLDLIVPGFDVTGVGSSMPMEDGAGGFSYSS